MSAPVPTVTPWCEWGTSRARWWVRNGVESFSAALVGFNAKDATPPRWGWSIFSPLGGGPHSPDDYGNAPTRELAEAAADARLVARFGLEDLP